MRPYPIQDWSDQLPRVYACNLDCQNWSGSASSVQFVMAENELEVIGEPALFELTAPEGDRTSRQRACPTCFTRVYNTNTRRPGVAVVRAGALDRSDEARIVAHIWTKRMTSGVVIPQDVPASPEDAPPAEFIAALTSDQGASPCL